MDINKIKEIANQQDFALHEYEEHGIVCGYDLEGWTHDGVNMHHFIDCRKDELTTQNILKELNEIYRSFDVDTEVITHLQDDMFRNTFSVREALEEFEAYESRLCDFVEAVKRLEYEPS